MGAEGFEAPKIQEGEQPQQENKDDGKQHEYKRNDQAMNEVHKAEAESAQDDGSDAALKELQKEFGDTPTITAPPQGEVPDDKDKLTAPPVG